MSLPIVSFKRQPPLAWILGNSSCCYEHRETSWSCSGGRATLTAKEWKTGSNTGVVSHISSSIQKPSPRWSCRPRVKVSKRATGGDVKSPLLVVSFAFRVPHKKVNKES